MPFGTSPLGSPWEEPRKPFVCWDQGGRGHPLIWYRPGRWLTEWTGSIPDTAKRWQRE